MHQNKCVPRGWLLRPSRLHRRKHTSISWALEGFFLMLVIQHLKERMPSGVSALIFPKWVGGILPHAGSHGFVLGRKGGTLYLLLYPCPLFLILSSYSSRRPWQSIQVSYCLPRGKSTGSIIQLLLWVCVMLACKWCYLDCSIHWSPRVATTHLDILTLRDSAIRIASSLWIFIHLLSYRHIRNLRPLHPSLCVLVPYSASNLCMLAH
jgi:hypothetical protein